MLDLHEKRIGAQKQQHAWSLKMSVGRKPRSAHSGCMVDPGAERLEHSAGEILRIVLRPARKCAVQ